ncbi:MAG: hypothetical protein QXO16_08310 [Archaeoglobaceae archaeon]
MGREKDFRDGRKPEEGWRRIILSFISIITKLIVDGLNRKAY